uniref:Uncharacterized protein n=1 Tax=Opuntia streptacantha TaxID=393608 RepID=A0A7C9AAM2_OPUST
MAFLVKPTMVFTKLGGIKTTQYTHWDLLHLIQQEFPKQDHCQSQFHVHWRPIEVNSERPTQTRTVQDAHHQIKMVSKTKAQRHFYLNSLRFIYIYICRDFMKKTTTIYSTL